MANHGLSFTMIYSVDLESYGISRAKAFGYLGIQVQVQFVFSFLQVLQLYCCPDILCKIERTNAVSNCSTTTWIIPTLA